MKTTTTKRTQSSATTNHVAATIESKAVWGKAPLLSAAGIDAEATEIIGRLWRDYDLASIIGVAERMRDLAMRSAVSENGNWIELPDADVTDAPAATH